MRKISILILGMALSSCESISCDCEYVVYEKTTGSSWRETYRSDWDASCGDEVLDRSQFTSWDGSVTYSKTEIECR